MKQKLAKQAIAATYPILYLYVIANILLEAVNLPLAIRHEQNIPKGGIHTLSNKGIVITGLIGLLVYLLVYGYMLFTKNDQRLVLILKIILALELLGVAVGLIRLTYTVIFVIIQALFTFVVLQRVQGKKSLTLF